MLSKILDLFEVFKMWSHRKSFESPRAFVTRSTPSELEVTKFPGSADMKAHIREYVSILESCKMVHNVVRQTELNLAEYHRHIVSSCLCTKTSKTYWYLQ